MDEPRLMTESEHFSAWEAYNPLGHRYYELEVEIFACALPFGFNGIVAAEIYGTGHSRCGPLLMIGFMVITVLFCLVSLMISRYQRSQYQLWSKYYPYDPEREFSIEDFEHTIT